jgi:single-strand DNA-binding protein
MKSLNQVQLIGWLGADPEVKNLSNEGKLCNLSLATDYSYKSKTGEVVTSTDWHRITFFGKFCESLANIAKKGDALFVSGRLHTRSYEDANGVKKYVTEILGESCIFLSYKKPSTGNDSSN